ncbi:ThiF family adenylyltransferase [Actinomyces weissii]|uniref:ThiF family adenylyltransferase n=1 Tax=Actinomyces weissii TaxID=675090 RepID=A0A7T7S1C2_9ACTO|nr:ThiF family adenylyltransferase [Actinomyces weissii]
MSIQNPEVFQRQLAMPDIGPRGQAALARATVGVVGAGGLGFPVLSYLAAAGVGSIKVVDSDTVNVTNLNRQLFYT